MYIKRLLLFFILITIFSWINPQHISAAACVDMLEYFKPNSNSAVLSSGGLTYVVEDGRKIGGLPTFYLAKSQDGSVYEEFAYDNNYIYHGRDTSWATGPGQDVSCLDGRPAGFTMVDGSVSGCGGVDLENYTPAKWVKRNMCEGDVMSSSHTVVAFAKDGTTCGCCEAPYTGQVSFKMKFNKVHDVYPNPNKPEMPTLRNVVEIEIIEGNGQGEKFLFNKEYGWVGFIRPNGERNIADKLITPKPNSPIDYCPLVNSDLDGLSCLSPKVGSSDGACATCSSSSVVPNQTNIFAQLINAITGYFKTELKATLVLENFKGGIPDLNPISNLKGNAQETPLATFLLETPDLNRDGSKPPKIAVLDRMAVPGKNIEENQAEHNKLAEAESKVEIYIKGADNDPPPIQNADKRIIQAQTYASTVANNFWSTPNNQISWIAPVGYTLSEAFGSEKAQKYQQYLAEANTSYLAKNYSNGQKNLLVEKAIERKIYNNTKRYNPTALNNNNSVSLAATENLDTPACLFPERTSVKATCTELLGDVNRGVEIVKDRNAGDALCDASKQSCNSNSHPMDAIVYRHFYGGNETITQGIQEPCDAKCALKQNSGENLIASSRDIQLTGTGGSYRGSFNTPGFTALASTYFLAFVPPETAIEEEFLTAKSEEVPIELSSQRVGGIGSIQSNSNEEISVGGFAKNCSLKLLQALSLIPGSDEAEAYERILGKCKGTAEFASQSYCGTAQTQISSNSQNFIIARERGASDPNASIPGQITDPSNPYYFIDTGSSLRLKVATRFIDGATVILNHEVVPMNPGQTSAARCGGSGESPNPSWVEIQYLPLTYTGDINNQGSWDRDASHGFYTPISNSTGHPFTNTLIDLKVKEGYYKVKVIHMACFSGNTEYVNGMSQVIKLVEGSTNPDETQYCSKVTINSNMPGGGYAHPITKEPYENDQDEIMGCKLQENYNVLANNSCGGLHGREEDDFWDKVARVTSIGIGSLEYKGYTYSKGDLRKGKEMYKRLFGREFTSQSDPSCSSYFPNTIAKADCGNLDNRDVSQSSPNTAGQGPGVSLNPPYEAQSILNPPLNGKAMYYGQGLMDEVINNRIAWGDITAAQQAKMATGYYKGYVALLRKGDIGREVYITNPTNSRVEGPFLVVDVAARHDIASLLNRGWVVDIDYETATRWDMNGRGPTGHNGPRNVQVFGERP